MKLWWLAVLSAAAVNAQRGTGELRLSVADATGSAIEAAGALVNQSIQFHQSFTTDDQGRYIVRNLPFGKYRLEIERQEFGKFSGLVEIKSEVPLDYKVTLSVAPVETSIVVEDAATLLDPHRTAPDYFVGEETLGDRRGSTPGRAVIDLVEMQPGWLVEANGVLHPRGAEYGTQYVVDGFPVVDNRSPAFAPGLDADEIASMNVRTAGYPAEYGRKLGGVIEVTTKDQTRAGWHGTAVLNGGSFATAGGTVAAQYARGKTMGGVSLDSAHTERYLDPPVLENYTNKSTSAGESARFATSWSESDRLRLAVTHRRVGFLVPDEGLQFQAGQRQDRRSEEASGQVAYQRTLAPWLIANARGMVRDLAADFWSNPAATPILAGQSRGFRESYASGDLAAHRAGHEMKAGAEVISTGVHENFSYRITDVRFFPPDVPLQFRFADRRRGLEGSAFVQDLWQTGRWTFSAGLRWDHYRLLVDESAVSPRLGASWYWPAAGLVLRASYDRAFEIPAIENLLLASSPAAQHLTGTSTGLPVRPSRGNFYEGGLSKAFLGRVRLEASYFERTIRNFADDDLLLNTGVSFPIAFSRAAIHGVEAKIEIPRWGPVSGFLSYSNMAGVGRLPITGGLFLENGVQLLHEAGSFAITQDQRNSAHSRVRYQLWPRLWAALGASYGSGLPIELDTDVPVSQLMAQFGERVIDRVNLSRGRVRPSFSMDASVGAELWKHESRSVRVQADVLNLTNRLNVINFAGLFSGTAIAPPRTAAVRLEMGW
ncbi:MAG TPA: TonB-dependent receptor [Bryobacteraceae bacterium]|nr:TonB-dependent receptor [Bryobacteraceae bacterium]